MKHEGIDNKWDYNKGVVTGDTCQHEEGTYLHLPARPAQHRTPNNVPMVQHPHMTHLHPLLSYSPEAFSPQRASPGFSPDTGISRSPHTACYPVSPGGMAQITHPLGWLPGQPMYPLPGGFSPAALAMNASMSSLMTGGFSPRLVPTSQSSSPHPSVAPPVVKQEPGVSNSSQPGTKMPEGQHEKEDDKRFYIKKPLNAFMLYMREERPKVVAQCNVKESATINQILGQRWHSLTKEEQAKYYEMARKERLVHSKLYPGWSARENYGKKKKRKRSKSESNEEGVPPQLKRPPVPPEEKPHTQTAHTQPRPFMTQPHTVSHLTHTQLSQASPASSLDSPATPTTALASPAAPAATHTEHTHSTNSSYMSPYGEQLQPLSLTTKPHRTPHPTNHNTGTPGPSTPSSSTDTPTPSPLMTPSRCSPPPHLPPPLPPLLSQPFLAPPPTSAPPSAVSSHSALTQSQQFSRRTNQL
ncbi:hypothetical protein fugu_019051 [Takifugu bimaculatus]|uniref:HMG box domain-containing protein n=1 Tax=Takifugu bimaculatus TaxID=433685 RepID=A0A4Z2BJ76_9TELE|nr:hypothetical protein fugu_019051 [Takifugu bimaculatus]